MPNNAINKSNKTGTLGYLRIKENKENTFKNISLKKRRVKLKRLITVFNHVLMKLQLTITKRSIAVIERNIDQRNENEKNLFLKETSISENAK